MAEEFELVVFLQVLGVARLGPVDHVSPAHGSDLSQIELGSRDAWSNTHESTSRRNLRQLPQKILFTDFHAGMPKDGVLAFRRNGFAGRSVCGA
jgi:hypothetical protein